MNENSQDQISSNISLDEQIQIMENIFNYISVKILNINNNPYKPNKYLTQYLINMNIKSEIFNKLYEKVIKSENVIAINNLAYCYMCGDAVLKDCKKAYMLY